MASTTTVRSSSPARRVVRRARPAIDPVWVTVLADFDPALHQPIIRYVETMRAAYEARTALSSELTGTAYCWRDVDRVAHALTFAD